jgi:MYXO-CTERM domain-containing protein
MRSIEMLKSFLAVIALGVGLSVLGVTPVRADDVSLDLTNGFVTCPVGGCAEVTITAAADGTSATLEFTSLLSGYQFDDVGFNFTGGTITGITPKTPKPGGTELDGFGSFGYAYDTGNHGGSTGHLCDGTMGDADCDFTLTITGTGLSVADFETVGNADTYFAGHLASANCTGFVGGGGSATSNPDDNGACSSTSAPEPGTSGMLTIGLIGLLLLGLGFSSRRRLLRADGFRVSQ